MRKAKSSYFADKIQECSRPNDIKGSWSLINTLLGRNKKSTNITELIVNQKSVSDDQDTAEFFNDYFANIGMRLAAKCQSSSSNFGQRRNCSASDVNSDNTNGACFRFPVLLLAMLWCV